MNNKKRFNFAVRIIVVLWFSSASSALVLDDNGQISATEVSHVIHVKSESDIKEAIHKANNQHLSIAIMGKRYSQGGHTLSPHAIELDMLSFNKVLELNETK
ncbi:MAG: FAD-binding protein, partial [Nitrosopumilus sp.]|nr:FAD-binding protein [Nitrosopumilus sp.]